jgi:murein DD-endopeptidase MepM/ murein hydrolase activator NlpD
MSLMKKPGWQGKAGLLVWGVLGLGLVASLAWIVAGRLDFDDPWVKVKTPLEVVGAKTVLAVEAGDESSGLKEVKVTFTQGSQEKVVLERKFPPGGAPGEKVELPVTLEPKALGFKEGKATLKVQVRDRSWRHMFQGRTAQLTQEVAIDLVPITIAFQSMSHLLHAGGTGVITYRLNKAAKESGVLMGGRLYQGFPNPKGGPNDYVVLFPVPQEASGPAQAELVARPSLGTEVKQVAALKVKPRKWRHDKLNLNDDFLRKVASSLPVSNPSDLLGSYLEVNRETRRKNHDKFRQVGGQSSPKPLWSGAFMRFYGKPMARFGDRRTYMYHDKPVDQQTHLGEDLASLLQSPVKAGNNGVVVLAEPLGIYGQTVILDHGLGVFSSYSHMSQIDVKAGDQVEKGATLGKTGTTGLAGGDHLHFAMLLQGEFVDPLEWWDPHWLKDQVEGVWVQAAAPAPGAAAAAAGEEPATKVKGKGKKKPGKAKAKAAKKKKKN